MFIMHTNGSNTNVAKEKGMGLLDDQSSLVIPWNNFKPHEMIYGH